MTKISTLDHDRWGHPTDRFVTEQSQKMLALDGDDIGGLMTARELLDFDQEFERFPRLVKCGVLVTMNQ